MPYMKNCMSCLHSKRHATATLCKIDFAESCHLFAIDKWRMSVKKATNGANYSFVLQWRVETHCLSVCSTGFERAVVRQAMKYRPIYRCVTIDPALFPLPSQTKDLTPDCSVQLSLSIHRHGKWAWLCGWVGGLRGPSDSNLSRGMPVVKRVLYPRYRSMSTMVQEYEHH